MARLDKTADTKLWQHTVAHAAALGEANLDRLASGRGWGYRPGLAVTWLDLLTAYGHQPADIEQVRDDADAARRSAPPTATTRRRGRHRRPHGSD